MTRIFDGVCDAIGGTSLLRLRRIEIAGGAELCAKLEARNPSGSVKDRAAHAMIAAAEADGRKPASRTAKMRTMRRLVSMV